MQTILPKSNTTYKFFTKSKLALLALFSAASLNAMASETGWRLNFTNGQRDIYARNIAYTNYHSFRDLNQTLMGGTGVIEALDDYGNEGSVKIGIYDNDGSIPIGTLILTQSNYSGSQPSTVPDVFGTEVAGAYDACKHLNAKKVDSWICYKYVQNTSYSAYLKPDYTQLAYLVLEPSNFYGGEDDNSDKYGTVRLTLNMVAKNTPTPQPTQAPTIHDFGNWDASQNYSVIWTPSEIYPVVQHPDPNGNNTTWIACSTATAGQEPGNSSPSNWNAWEVYTKHNCGRDFN